MQFRQTFSREFPRHEGEPQRLLRQGHRRVRLEPARAERLVLHREPEHPAERP